MSIFITGATGYIGSYVVSGLLRRHSEALALLVRAKTLQEARERLWKSLQLHMDFAEFRAHIDERVELVLGDITHTRLGLAESEYQRLAARTESIIHIAASLNRRSAKTCLNVNLRGSLEVIKLARAAQATHELRRFSDVSTVAVAGTRDGELVSEDSAIDWQRSDYDPYARTKKFAEHMLNELLPDVPHTVFRPSIVLGDSRFAATTQFDMVRAFALLARLPVLPFNPEWRLDIVPADYVGRAIVELHQREPSAHGIYHLSAGAEALSYDQIVGSLKRHGRPLQNVFAPVLNKPFQRLVDGLTLTPARWGLSRPAALLEVFLPYLCFDTVFDNSRVVRALGEKPAPFSDYASALLDFAIDQRMTYPYAAWPRGEAATVEALYA
jgi:thioester reductase-like protein